MKATIIALVAGAGLLASGVWADNTPSAAGLNDGLAYDQAYWSRPHNPYETAHFPDILDVLERGNRVVELDVWESGGNLVVKHEPTQGDLDNNCQGGTGGWFADCLTNLASWIDNHPNHLPITLQLDLKAGLWYGWGASARQQLNATLANELGSRLLTPEQLRQHTGHAQLREGVLAAGWPTLGSMRGKVLVLITGGPIGAKNQTQRAYVEQFGANANALVCPQAEGAVYFDAYGSAKDFDGYAANDWVVCGNTEAIKYVSQTLEASALNRQLVNLWASDEHRFDAFHQAYMAVASGGSMISRETPDTYGQHIPLNGERRSIPTRFALQAEHSGLCLTVENAQYGNGSDLIQTACTGNANQLFRYSDETQLRSVGNETYCFDIEGGQSTTGKPLHLWDCDGGDSEQWRLTTQGQLIGMGDRCAEIPNGSQSSGVQARLADCNGSSAWQRFAIQPL